MQLTKNSLQWIHRDTGGMDGIAFTFTGALPTVGASAKTKKTKKHAKKEHEAKKQLPQLDLLVPQEAIQGDVLVPFFHKLASETGYHMKKNVNNNHDMKSDVLLVVASEDAWSRRRWDQVEVHEPKYTKKNLAKKTCKRNQKPRNMALSRIVPRGRQQGKHIGHQRRIYWHKAVLSSVQTKKHQDHDMQKKNMQTHFQNQGSDVVPVVLNGPVVTTTHHDLPKIGKGPFAFTLSDPQLNVASHLCDNVNLKDCPNAAGWKKSKQTTHANPNQSNKQHAMSLNVFSTYFHAIHPAIFFPLI